ncbi:unnamed protein product [Gordionus sp. m RMFG-2023]
MRIKNFVINVIIISIYFSPFFCKKEIEFDITERQLNNGFFGIIREDEYLVQITPSIRVITKPGVKICYYEIAVFKNISLPFQIHIKNKITGLASIVATEKLNCQLHQQYDFNITAVKCEGSQPKMYSQTVPVHIQVLDVNNYDPYFEQQSYNVEMEVGKFYKKIIQLKAIDKDCSYDYSSICSYTFIRDQTFEKHDNNSVHNIFEINSDGVVRNIKPVIYDIGKSIILKIIAEDCGGRKSKPVLLIVKILPNNTCSNSWTYLSNKKFYTPLNEIMEIVPDARLHICQIQDCEVLNFDNTFF